MSIVVLSDGVRYPIGRVGRVGRRYALSDGSAGAPRRGAFFIARASRHEVPMTPGIPVHPYPPDPARVSHTRGELDSATPWRGRGIDCDARSTGRRGYAPPTCG